MKLALKIIGYLVGLVVLFLAVGLLLPATFTAQRSVVISAPAEKIYPLVAETKAWKRWAVWNQRDPNMKITYGGPESGIGAKWAWQSKSEGSGSMEFTQAAKNQRLSYSLSFDDMSPSNGEFVFTPQAGGTKITWTMQGDAGMNPVGRWFGYFIDRLVGPDFEAGLTNLKKLVEAS
jgi:uncharacterized protein YndB with AHSA1/START domain